MKRTQTNKQKVLQNITVLTKKQKQNAMMLDQDVRSTKSQSSWSD